ncbi:hypothetical protein [Actinacidiphila sp. ITFR-21]|uniref:hypothetical protein n=1 Tax=Actinacidiphila sp. ITFR-21 TaxID=3075199 RepID=UPI00288A2E14|nr:hypothetical protein [Streptomyces sp. ITFR-21]WNI19913.1 hypothetical protein RLT57_30680 [Streptomyces sp. ITFR-21]WNI20207.1 hypothetical protein RLT57_32225 [Streptomyces sp. ITFR-21]
MSGTKSFTTQAGSTYSYSVETGENGEAVYDLSRVFQEGAMPIGSIVVHPDYNLNPAVPGLLNIQFGKGSTDRHERVDVPMLGDGDLIYVVGHQLVNPADLDVNPEDEKSDPNPKITFHRTVLGAHFPTNAPSGRASTATFEKVRDLVTALVTEYRADKATAKREAQYAAFLNGQRAEAIQPEIDKIDSQIKALQLARAELTEKLNGYKAA